MAPVGHWNPWYPPAPSPPVLLSKLPFSTFPFDTFRKASHTPDLGVGGFERAAPTAADPRDKLLSESVKGCSGNVLKMAADCVHHVAWSRPAMGRSKHSVHWQCKRRLLWDSGSRCRMLELGSNGCDKLCMVPETRFRKQEPRGETRPGVAVQAPGRPEGPPRRKHSK